MMIFSYRCPFHTFVLGAASTGLAVFVISRLSLRKKNITSDVCIPDKLTESSYSKELKIATACAIEAGENILKALNETKSVDLKGKNDFVTKTDKDNEKMIFETLTKYFPSYNFVGEETSSETGGIPDLTDAPTWIVDPVDGCVSIGLVVHGIPVVGVVFAPSTNELFQCIRGFGAYLNGRRIFSSGAKAIDESLITTEFGYQREPEKLDIMFRCLRSVIDQGAHAIRQLGSGALDLCYVASGKLDAVYAGVAGEGWKPWDYAAGCLMVTEGGGCMGTVDGVVPFHTHGNSVLAAASESLKNEMQTVLKAALTNT